MPYRGPSVFELLVILGLTLLNALLSGAEMAVVSVRRARLLAAADAGSRRAEAVLALRKNPERFLATVQIGITLLGAIAGAFGGSSLAVVVKPWFEQLPVLAPYAKELSLALVVALITYLSVVLGELIPKSLVLRHAEPIALALAGPIQLLERLAAPLSWLLVKSSNVLLMPFRDSTNFMESKLTREDLAAMVSEAASQSELPQASQLMIERAVEFGTLRVGDVMVHRRSVVSLPKEAGQQAMRRAFVDAGHRRLPVHEGTLDNVIGYVLRDDVMARLWDGEPVDLPSILRPAYFVPESMTADRALRELQARRMHLAIVADEHGGIAGIITMEDLLEELVGEIFHEHDTGAADAAQRQADGSWIVQGSMAVRDFARASGLELDHPDEVRSMGGLVVHRAGGALPEQGSWFEADDGIALQAAEVSTRRVRLVRVRLGSAPQQAANPSA